MLGLILPGNSAQGGGGGGSQIARSLRFNPADSPGLSRTPGANGDRKRAQFRCRVRLGQLGTKRVLFSAGTSNIDALYFDTDNKLKLQIQGVVVLVSTAVFRDPTAWYEEIGFNLDATQGTAANRADLIVSGAAIGYGSDARSSIANTNTNINATVVQYIGRDNAGNYFDGFMAEPIITDNAAVGAYSAAGDCVSPTHSVGTQGALLDFSDNSNTTAATLGADRSGNGNNFTPANFSVASGVGNDSVTESPTNYDDGTVHGGFSGLLSGNYQADLGEPLNITNAATYSQGRMSYGGGANNGWNLSTMMMVAGKWYMEVIPTASGIDGLVRDDCGFFNNTPPGGAANSWAVEMATGNLSVGGSIGVTLSGSDVLGIAFDADNGKLWFAKNGTWTGGGDPAAGTSPAISGLSTAHGYRFVLGDNSATAQDANFGQRPFNYTPPTGFKALCTQNLPVESAVTSGSFTGNADADGPIVGLLGAPTALSINGNAVVWGTHAIKLASGFKVIVSSSIYNAAGSNTFTATVPVKRKVARAQLN